MKPAARIEDLDEAGVTLFTVQEGSLKPTVALPEGTSARQALANLTHWANAYLIPKADLQEARKVVRRTYAK